MKLLNSSEIILEIGHWLISDILFVMGRKYVKRYWAKISEDNNFLYEGIKSYVNLILK